MERTNRPSRQRSILGWPPEAAEIAEGPGDSKAKCEKIAAVSKNDKQDCWRFLKGFGVERPPELKRQHYQWPTEALEIAGSKDSFVSKCEQLKRLTGYAERVCRAFLKRQGARPPRGRGGFSEAEFQRLYNCVENYGYKEAALRFKVELKTVYDAVYRRGWTSRARDGYTLRDLHMFLCIRSTTILRWVELGLLKARITPRNNGKLIHRFDGPEVLRFCRENMPKLLPRRWPLKRLKFMELLLINEIKHADQLPTREAKKEQEAYENREEEAVLPPKPAVAYRSGDDTRNNNIIFDDCA